MPLDIANLILDKLLEMVEHIRFGAVCKRWYVILKQYVKPSCNILPMLLVTPPSVMSRDDARQHPSMLFALSSLGKHYSNLKLPLLLPYNHRRYIGTSHGWFATQNLDFTFTVVCPFDNKIFHLPPLKSFNLRHLEVDRLVISPDSTPSDYTVVATYYLRNEFATIKAGEYSWVFINTLSNSLFNDIIFYQGAVYLVDRLCKIIKVDVHSRPPVIKAVHRLFGNTKDKAVHRLFGNTEEQHTPYLVESTSSDLYLLQRFYHRTCTYTCPHICSRTSRFNIFKLKVHGDKFIAKKKSKGMKGDTFFIGDTSMAIKSIGCIPNAIYFTDYYTCVPYPDRCYIVANYSIEDGALRSVYETKYVGARQPIWTVPQQHFAPTATPVQGC
ncbi:hypothetical protein QQ045_008679 [Rhodiola kirilowii]